MRKLTFREKVLLVLLAVTALICGYVFLFHLPMEERVAQLDGRIQSSRDLLSQTQAMVARQGQMEEEIAALTSADPAPVPMPDYDDIQAVMVELNRVLDDAQEYTLRFSSAQPEDRVVARQVTLPFRCASYDAARAILQGLHDCPLRCQLEDVSITQGEDGSVQVNATVTFYEYAGG